MRAAQIISTLLLVAAGTAQAGRLELTNGAVIPGDFKRIDHGKIVWDAELIGEIAVEAAAVKRLDASTPVHLRSGTTDLPQGCPLSALGSDVTIACADRPPIATRWDEIGKANRVREGTGKITTSLTKERGNSYSDEYEVDARASWRRANLRHNLDGSVDYEKKRAGTTEDEAELDYQLDFLLRRDWYVYGRTYYYRDRFASVQEGLLGGSGIGRSWGWSKNTNLLLQGGIDYGRFDIQGLGRVNETGGNLQWRIDHELDWWKWELTLFHEGQLAWVLRDSDLSHLETKSGLELPLLHGVIAELRLDYDRIGIDLPEVDNTDIEWVFALGYKW